MRRAMMQASYTYHVHMCDTIVINTRPWLAIK